MFRLPPFTRALSLCAVLVGIALFAGELSSRPPQACPIQKRRSEALAALGYVETVLEDAKSERRGVTAYEPAAAEAGVNVLCSVRGDEARFLDMEGNELHRVRFQRGSGQDCLVEPYRPGLLLVLSDPYLSLIDWSSKPRWIREGFHHDFAVDGRGRVLSFSAHPGVIEDAEGTLPARSHSLVVLAPDGRTRREIDLLPLVADRIPTERIASMRRVLEAQGAGSARYARVSDVLHPNSIEWVTAQNGVAERGQVLVSFRELDLVAVLDLAKPRVVWSWGPGELDRPHHPSFRPNGDILVFDNGAHRGYSRVLEVEPKSGTIVWEYSDRTPPVFFSQTRGAAMGLPGGDVLITESAKGRVFEVDRDGRIVWEFLNPDFAGPSRRQIYRMPRLMGDALRGTPLASANAR